MRVKMVRYKLPLWTVIDSFVRTGRWQRWHYVGVPAWDVPNREETDSELEIKL